MFNLSSQKLKGTWFYFDSSDPDNGGVCLREPTPKDIDEIERLTVKITKKFRGGQMYEVRDVNESLAAKLRFDKIIVDWNKVALDGTLLECNRENKNKVMQHPDMIKFVADSMEKLADNNPTLAEAQLKNLPSSPDGNSVEKK